MWRMLLLKNSIYTISIAPQSFMFVFMLCYRTHTTIRSCSLPPGEGCRICNYPDINSYDLSSRAFSLFAARCRIHHIQVLKHEYLNKPSLVGAGVFGLDDVFARIKPFVSRNLRPLSSPVDSSGERDDSHEDGSNQEHLFIDRVGGVFAQGASDVTRLPCALHGDDISGANSKEKGAEEGPGKHGGQRQKVSNVGPKYPGDGGNCESDRPTNQRRHRIPPLYFASVDIKHCYDTVDQVTVNSHLPVHLLGWFRVVAECTENLSV